MNEAIQALIARRRRHQQRAMQLKKDAELLAKESKDIQWLEVHVANAIEPDIENKDSSSS